MYCFWVEKAVVHVPMGGDLKLMVMLLLRGEWIVVVFEKSMVGGYWHSANASSKQVVRTFSALLEVVLIVCCTDQPF